ncbi:MAG: dihydrolipoamide acetyltransferase family protein [Acidimicrobiia bacterium]
MGEFRMPSLGADMDTGTITRWLVHPGDTVHRGDIVAVVDTDKADVDVEIFEDGIVEAILVPEGTEVAVGTPLARVTASAPASAPAPGTPSPTAVAPREAGGVAPSDAGLAEPPMRWHEPSAAAAPSPLVRRRAEELGIDLQTVTGSGTGNSITRADVERAADDRAKGGSPRAEGGGPRASPRARRLAREQGIDLSDVTATGPGGAVVGADVEASGTDAAVTPPLARSEPSGPSRRSDSRAADKAVGMRAAIARAMARSKREIPHYYLATDIDLSRAQEHLRQRNETRPVAERVLPATLLLKATALAVRSAPELNGFWVDGELHPSSAVHLGVAISLRGGGGGPPAIHDADGLSIDELMAALRDLVRRARLGSLRASEMSDPTITVTSLGEQGVSTVYGVIYPPQVALVGFGAVSERPWAVDGMVGAHTVVTATLAADHRASDGVRGARLLEVIDRLLQEPEEL